MELREGWLAALLLTDLAGPDEDVRHGDAGEGEGGVQRHVPVINYREIADYCN